MYNIEGAGREDKEEVVAGTIEKYTRQLKNSGWSCKEAREIIINGYKGLMTRKRRRDQEGKDLYRSAASSLLTRVRKKLTGREDWYKTNKKREREEDGDDEEEKREWKKKRRNPAGEEPLSRPPVAVMFVPFTKGGELARRLTEAEIKLETSVWMFNRHC